MLTNLNLGGLSQPEETLSQKIAIPSFGYLLSQIPQRKLMAETKVPSNNT